MDEMEVQELVEQHADYVCSLVRKIYVEAMIHGYKHGYEDGYNDNEAR